MFIKSQTTSIKEGVGVDNSSQSSDDRKHEAGDTKKTVVFNFSEELKL